MIFERAESVTVGGMVSAQIGWGSTSATTSAAIQTAVSADASAGLGSISAAVAAGNSQSGSTANTHYTFASSSIGGGAILAAALTDAKQANAATQVSCLNGSVPDCNTFATDFNVAISNGIESANGFMAAYQNSPQDLSGLVAFPQPVLDVEGQSPMLTESIAALLAIDPYNDLYIPYAAALNNYTSVYNQILTLSNRAQYLYTQLQGYPSTTLNVASYIQPLIDQYGQDASVMLSNLGQCLVGATPGTVATLCAPIIALYGEGGTNSVKSAWDWYGPNGPNPHGYAAYALNSLQDNAIALQYAGNYSDTFTNPATYQTIFNMDMVWINQLPGDGGWPPSPALPYGIYGNPALAGFVDSPWTFLSNPETPSLPYNLVLPLSKGADITSPIEDWLSRAMSIVGNSLDYGYAPVTLAYSNGCQNTSFSSPCTMTMYYNQEGADSRVAYVTLTPINAFFGP